MPIGWEPTALRQRLDTLGLTHEETVEVLYLLYEIESEYMRLIQPDTSKGKRKLRG